MDLYHFVFIIITISIKDTFGKENDHKAEISLELQYPEILSAEGNPIPIVYFSKNWDLQPQNNDNGGQIWPNIGPIKPKSPNIEVNMPLGRIAPVSIEYTPVSAEIDNIEPYVPIIWPSLKKKLGPQNSHGVHSGENSKKKHRRSGKKIFAKNENFVEEKISTRSEDSDGQTNSKDPNIEQLLSKSLLRLELLKNKIDNLLTGVANGNSDSYDIISSRSLFDDITDKIPGILANHQNLLSPVIDIASQIFKGEDPPTDKPQYKPSNLKSVITKLIDGRNLLRILFNNGTSILNGGTKRAHWGKNKNFTKNIENENLEDVKLSARFGDLDEQTNTKDPKIVKPEWVSALLKLLTNRIVNVLTDVKNVKSDSSEMISSRSLLGDVTNKIQETLSNPLSLFSPLEELASKIFKGGNPPPDKPGPTNLLNVITKPLVDGGHLLRNLVNNAASFLTGGANKAPGYPLATTTKPISEPLIPVFNPNPGERSEKGETNTKGQIFQGPILPSPPYPSLMPPGQFYSGRTYPGQIYPYPTNIGQIYPGQNPILAPLLRLLNTDSVKNAESDSSEMISSRSLLGDITSSIQGTLANPLNLLSPAVDIASKIIKGESSPPGYTGPTNLLNDITKPLVDGGNSLINLVTNPTSVLTGGANKALEILFPTVTTGMPTIFSLVFMAIKYLFKIISSIFRGSIGGLLLTLLAYAWFSNL